VIVLLGWGALLLLGAVLQLCLGADTIELALQGGVGVAAVAVGVALALGRRRRARLAVPPHPGAGAVATEDIAVDRPAADPRLVDRSLATTLAAFGVALMAFGAEAGPWLVLMGAGATALGLGGVLRQRREVRR
jgi:hypothetical protein